MITASSVEQAGRIAGLPRRAAAYLLDCLLLFAGVVAFHVPAYAFGFNPIANGTLAATGVNLHLWVFGTASLPILLYFWLFFRRGATPGCACSACGSRRPARRRSQNCYRVCRKGKACGNSCIARSYTCWQPTGRPTSSSPIRTGTASVLQR